MVGFQVCATGDYLGPVYGVEHGTEPASAFQSQIHLFFGLEGVDSTIAWLPSLF